MKKLFAAGVAVLFALAFGRFITPTFITPSALALPCGAFTNNNTNFLACGGRLWMNLTTNSTNGNIVYVGTVQSGTNVYHLPPGKLWFEILDEDAIKVRCPDFGGLMWPRVSEGEPVCQELLEECVGGLGVSGVYPDLDFTIANNTPDYSGWDWLEVIGIVEAEVTEDENESCDYYSFWVILYDPFSDYAVVVLFSRTDDYNCPSRPAP